MSTQVDERVVQMKFDSKNFDQNIAETIKELNVFESKLKLLGAKQGMNDLQKSVDSMNFNPLLAGADKVQGRFDVMSVAVIAAVNNMTNKVVDSAQRMVHALTFEQVENGWSKYADKTSAVQTIMAATAKNFEDTGEQMAFVNAELEKLNWFTDETSYSFLDMVNNIGKFTSNNIGLQESVTAMQGISTWAAVSGAKVQEAGRAMYNLSQAMATGSVKLIDWKSIENANMATAEFKETVIETAAEMGLLVKKGEGIYGVKGAIDKTNVSVSNFNEDLSQGWFTADVLMKTLNQYGEFATDLYRVTENLGGTATDWLGWIDDYKAGSFDASKAILATNKDAETLTKTLEILSSDKYAKGLKAFRAAQEAKTFAEAIDSVKDAVSTGWMNTFEIIFGDYEKAKKLWTGLANELYSIFAEGAWLRNDMLTEWAENNGREDLFAGIAQGWNNIKDVIYAVKEAFEEIFPPMTGKKLADLTKGFLEFTKQIKLSEGTLATLKNTAKLLMIPLRVLWELLKTGVVLMAVLARETIKLLDSLGSLIAGTKTADNVFRKLFGDDRYERMVDKWADALERLGAAFAIIGKRIGNAFASIKIDTKKTNLLQKVFQTIYDILAPIASWLLDALVEGVEELASLDYSKISEFANTTLTNMLNNLKGMGGLFEKAAVRIENFFNTIKSTSPEEALDNLVGVWYKILDFPKQAKSLLSMNTVYQTMQGHIQGLSDVFAQLGESMAKMLQRLSAGKILLFSFGVALTGSLISITNIASLAGNALKGFSTILTNTGKLLGAWYDKIRYDRIRQIAAALLALSVALIALAAIKPERLESAKNAMLSLMAGLVVMIGVITALDKLVLKNDSKGFARIASSLASLAIAISLMTGVLTLLLMVPVEGIWTRVAVLGAIMLELVGVAVLLNKMPKDISAKMTLTLIPFAFAVASLVNSLKVIGKMDLVSILKGMFVLPFIMAELAGVSIIMKSTKFSSSLGVLAFALGLIAMGKALEVLGGMNWQKMTAGIIFATAAMTSLVGLAIILRKIDTDISAVTKSMFQLAVAIGAMSLAVALIGMLDTEKIVKGTLAVGALIIFMGVFGKLMSSKYGGEHAASVGKSFVSMAIAIDLLTIAIHYLGSLPLKVVAQGMAVVGGLMVLFGLILELAKSAKAGTASIIAITAALGMVLASIALLTLIPAEESMAAAKALALVLGALAAAVGASKLGSPKKWTQAIDTFASIAAYLIAAGATLWVLDSIDLRPDILDKVYALDALLVGLSGAMLILSGIGNQKRRDKHTDKKAVEQWAEMFGSLTVMVIGAGAALAALNALPIEPTIFEKLAAFGLLMAGMLVAMYAIAPIAKINLPKEGISSALLAFLEVLGVAVLVITAVSMTQMAFEKYGMDVNAFFQRSIPILITIGEAIGQFVGSIIGGIGAGAAKVMAAALPEIAEDLSDFADKASDFFSAMRALGQDNSAVKGVWNAVEMFTVLTGADLLTNMATLGGLLGNMKSLASDLKEAGPDLKDFANEMSGIPEDGLAGAKVIADIVGALSSALSEETGGIFAAFFGEKSISKLASELKTAGPDLKLFATEMAGIDGDFSKATKIVDIIKKFAEITPTQGGYLQKFTGEKNLELFGSQLEKFGISFSNFDMWMGSVKGGEAFDLAMKTAELVADFANTKVPTTGGIITWFKDNDLAQFGSWVESFGKSIGEFDKYTQEINEDILDRAELVRQAVNKILEADWGDTFFESGAKTGNVIENLKVYVHGLAEFAKQATDENYNLKDIGTLSIKELVSGIESALPELKTLADTVPRTLVVKAKEILGCLGNTSSSEFFNIGKYVIQGFTKGLQNRSDLKNLNEAAIAMAEGVLNAVLDYNKIESPSVLYKEEVGVYIVRGIAEGIKSDMSAEEAAKQKAQNIVNAFKSALESSEIQLALKQAQYDLWGSSAGLVADQQTQNNMKAQNFIDRLQAQAEATKNAEGAYLTAVKTLGEGHNETIKLQTEWIKAQNEGYKLAKEFAEFNASIRDNMVSAKDAARDYYNYMASDEVKKMLEGGISQAEINAYAAKKFGYEGSTNAKEYYAYMNSETVKKMLEGGISQEEIEKYAKEKFGYSAGRGLLTGLDESLTKGYNGTDIQSIYDHFFSGDVAVAIVNDAQNTGRSAGSAYSAGVREGIAAGTDGESGVWDQLTDIFKNATDTFGGEGSNLAENYTGSFIDTVNDGISAVGGAVRNWMGSANDAAKDEAQVNSPSRFTRDIGHYYVEGFVLGIDEYSHLATDAASRMVQAAAAAFTGGFNGSTLDATSDTLPWNSQMYQAGGYFMQAFASGFSDSYDHLQLAFSEAIAKLLNAVLETHPNWRQNGFDCGKLMMTGIVEGVESGKAAAINAIVNAAKEAYQQACEALGMSGGTISVSATTTTGLETRNIHHGGGISASKSSGTAGGISARTSTQMGSRITELAMMHDENGNLKTGFNVPAKVTNNYVFNQTNNSPKAISAAETYRLKNSGLAKFRNEVGQAK